MKDSFYFPHDYNAAGDQKILKLRVKFGNLDGYAMFFMTLEAMAQQDNGILPLDCIAELSLSYNLAIEKVQAFLEYCIEIGLFIKSKDGIYTKRMVDHKNYRKERAEAGRRGGLNRSKNSSAISSARNQLIARKGKKNKLKLKNPLPPLQGGEVFELLTKWFRELGDKGMASRHAMGYINKYGERIVSRALKDRACSSKADFIQLCQHYAGIQ